MGNKHGRMSRRSRDKAAKAAKTGETGGGDDDDRALPAVSVSAPQTASTATGGTRRPHHPQLTIVAPPRGVQAPLRDGALSAIEKPRQPRSPASASGEARNAKRGRAAAPLSPHTAGFSPSPSAVRVMDKYRLGEVLGRGAFNVVREATDMQTGRRYAAKIFGKRAADAKADTWKAMRKEVGVMHLAHHPAVVALHDVMESRSKIVLILELCEGGDLFSLVERRGPLPPAHAMRYFAQVLGALRHCRELGICHRDVKPGNLLLSADLRSCKLADFGLARLQRRSLCKTACGSPHYMAPETFQRLPYDGHAADIWSLGVVLYVMVEACLPFWAERTAALYADISAGRYEPPQTTPEIAEIIGRCLTVDPESRITADELASLPAVARANEAYAQELAALAPEGGAPREPTSPLFPRTSSSSSLSVHEGC